MNLKLYATMIVRLNIMLLALTGLVAAQTGGTVWCNPNPITLTGDRHLQVTADENVVVEKVEKLMPDGEWKEISQASSDSFKKCKDIDLGGDVTGDIRVLLRYNGAMPSTTNVTVKASTDPDCGDPAPVAMLGTSPPRAEATATRSRARYTWLFAQTPFAGNAHLRPTDIQS